MGRIKLLDEATINKIAAGEVIERPSSIVKELVENSIDAESTAITIEITDGGKSLISVSDNGCGIKDEDLKFVFERHATSKIKDSEDLFNIITLGFRGEAMSSIAAVSEVELRTKSEDEISGSYILVKGGNILERKSMGLPTGTSVIVRNLFYNTPARYKFLKSDLSEQGSIVDIVEKLALSNTAVSIKLIVNGKTVLHTPGNGDLLSVIHCIYGKNIAKSMLQLEYENAHINIEGYIGKPEIARGNSTYMVFSVNNRAIKNRMLVEAMRQAYKTLLMNNKFPFAIINISIDTDKLDVNVHPTKAEVKFSDDKAIFNTLYIAVKNCLNTSDLLFSSYEASPDREEEKLVSNEAAITYKQQQLPVEAFTAPKKENTDDNWIRSISTKETAVANKNIEADVEKVNRTYDNRILISNITNNVQEAKEDDAENFPELQTIGQLMNMYILAQSRDSFYIIDQHAAHERITYEYLMNKYDSGDISIQQLMLPLVLELSPKETVLLSGSFSIFQKLGFELEWFGENTIAIRAIPIIMGEPCSGEFFNDILSSLEGESKQFNSAKEKIIIRMACKNAIKAGATLSREEMDVLIKRLKGTKLPFTCPHGRPTIIKMTDYELEKKFKRVI